MASLGSLVIRMAVDTARFEGDLGRAAAVAESRMRNIRDTTQRAVAGIAAAGTAAAAAVGVALKAAVDRADDMRDMAAAAGVSVEQLSRLGFAAKQSGVDVEIVGKALAKLSKDGIPNANAELYRLADIFASMEHGPEKTAIAIDKFGERLGPGLIPLLNEGSAGLKEMAEQADRLGLTISTSTADAADKFNDKLGLLKGTVEGIANSLAAQLLPTLNDIADAMVETATKTESLKASSSTLGKIIKGLVDVGYTFYVMLDTLANSVVAVADAAAAAATGDLAEAKRVLLEENARQIEAERRLTEFTAKMWDERVSDAERANARLAAISRSPGQANDVLARFIPEGKKTDTKDKAKDSLGEIQVYARQMFNLANAQADAIDEINEAAKASNRRFLIDISNETNATLSELADQSQARAAQLSDGMSVYAEQAARNMQTAFADFLFDPFDKGIKGMLAGFIDTVRRMIAEAAAAEILKGFFSWGASFFGSGSSIGGFFGTMASNIGTRASGGPVSAGKPYLVGEQGPELFIPGMSGGILPNAAMAGGGGITINQSFDVRGADADRVMSVMPALLKRAKDEAVAEIRDLKARGRL